MQVSATPGTPAGAPPGPPQLLYAGEVDQSRVVLLHDGLRIARYAEPKDGTQGAALDFARVDGATAGRGERGGPGPLRRQRPLSDGTVGAYGRRCATC